MTPHIITRGDPRCEEKEGEEAMKILIACEFSGVVRDAFAARGHDAWSCDLLPTEKPGNHIQGDVLEILDEGWDLMIAHPPCTHLSLSGARWFEEKRADGRQKNAIDFFMKFINSPVEKICVENPMNIMGKIHRKPDQIIQPYYFGDEAQKTTWLWLKNLPRLIHAENDDLFNKKTHVGRGEFYIPPNGKPMPAWYAKAGRLDKEKRSAIRSKTFQGIADAMASQWG